MGVDPRRVPFQNALHDAVTLGQTGKIDIRRRAQAVYCLGQGAYRLVALQRPFPVGGSAGLRRQYQEGGPQAQGELVQLEHGQGAVLLGGLHQSVPPFFGGDALFLRQPEAQAEYRRALVVSGQAVGSFQTVQHPFPLPRQQVVVIQQPFPGGARQRLVFFLFRAGFQQMLIGPAQGAQASLHLPPQRAEGGGVIWLGDMGAGQRLIIGVVPLHRRPGVLKGFFVGCGHVYYHPVL